MSQRSVVRLFEDSADAFGAALTAVRPEHHHLSTPCEPLDVSELVARAVGHQNWVRNRIAGRADPPSYDPIEPGDWRSAFDHSTRSMVALLEQTGVMDRTVELAAGLTFSGSDVGVLAARNIFQFAWDLSVATGQDQDIASDVADELLEISRSRLVPQRGPDGFFGPEFSAPAGAPRATVLAGYLGRPV
ncbi:MAG TPA: TIGR03086 family metal-binding protein [Acidimicrobiales bacterium]|nr:TIGR03086 family metal-binding protein [Acidimicrobiales bacterium]